LFWLQKTAKISQNLSL